MENNETSQEPSLKKVLLASAIAGSVCLAFLAAIEGVENYLHPISLGKNCDNIIVKLKDACENGTLDQIQIQPRLP